MDSANEPLLKVQSLRLRFGGVVALDGLDLVVGAGEITALIGPNGAGKTTLFNCISGLVQPDGGRIQLAGRSIDSLAPHRIAALGVGRTFQSPAVFPALTVAENLMVGAHRHVHAGWLAGLLRPPGAVAEESRARDDALALAAELGLAPVADRPAGALTLALRKRLELGRALAGRPRLLLLDEPAAGLDAGERQALIALLLQLRHRQGLSVLLVEHHMDFVSALCGRVVVLNFGRCIADGAPDAVRALPAVREAYLGATADA